MCFPTVEAGIEVEERLPRYHGEPHRKRIRIVKDRNVNHSDEWTLIRSNNSARRYRSDLLEQRGRRLNPEPEPWHQHQVHPRLEHQLHHQHLPWQPQETHGQQHYPQLSHPPVPPPLPPNQRLGFPGPQHEQFQPQPYHQIGDVGPPVEEFVPGRLQAQIIEADPRQPRASMPPHLQVNLGPSRSRSRGRSRPGRRHGDSVYSDDSYEDGFRYARRPSRPPRSLYSSDIADSFDDLRRPRQRSRSRRRGFMSRR